MTDFLGIYFPEIFYVLCGLVCFLTAFRARKNESARVGTMLFWTLTGVIFAFGKLLPPVAVGGMLVVMGVLTVTGQVKVGKFKESTPEFRKASSERIGTKIFVPAVAVGLIALILSFVKYDVVKDGVATPTALNGAIMTGVACVVALALGIVICRPKMSETKEDTSRLLMQVGAACLLPQLLGALGSVFSEAGVGEVISGMISAVVPQGNIVVGVIVYVAGMVIFTMIMGNAFAAFTVITAGIGVPFVIAQGGTPAIIGVLGMTAGYCGTLMTPMAANFNIVPCAVLETKDPKWSVIRAQVPMALMMIVVHVILMLVLGF
ncbi:MAG: DUF979 domain-containing protein [Lachnospiraceae bacterium]|nr:DUF979 domain-containing protein [Lachnospiraceae bacterium]